MKKYFSDSIRFTNYRHESVEYLDKQQKRVCEYSRKIYVISYVFYEENKIMYLTKRFVFFYLLLFLSLNLLEV